MASLSFSSFSFLRNFSLSLSQAFQPQQPSVANLLKVNVGFLDSKDGVNIDDAFSRPAPIKEVSQEN